MALGLLVTRSLIAKSLEVLRDPAGGLLVDLVLGFRGIRGVRSVGGVGGVGSLGWLRGV